MGAIGAVIIAMSGVVLIASLVAWWGTTAVNCYKESFHGFKQKSYKEAIHDIGAALFFSALIGLVLGGCAIAYEALTTPPTKQEAACSK